MQIGTITVLNIKLYVDDQENHWNYQSRNKLIHLMEQSISIFYKKLLKKYVAPWSSDKVLNYWAKSLYSFRRYRKAISSIVHPNYTSFAVRSCSEEQILCGQMAWESYCTPMGISLTSTLTLDVPHGFRMPIVNKKC